MRVRLALICAAIALCGMLSLRGRWGGAADGPRRHARRAEPIEARPVPSSFHEPDPPGADAERESPGERGPGETASPAIQAAVEPPEEEETDEPPKKAAAHEAARAELFGGKIPRISIRIPRDSRRALDSDPRSYAPCTVVADGVTYENVGIHLKGAAGSFRSLRDRPGLTLSFKRSGKGKLFHGMRKIHLNNSVQDWSFLSEILCSEMFLACGVPAARATHARVELDGRDMGLYVLVEGMDRAFLDRHFKGHLGNLYDGGFCQEIGQHLRRLSGREGEGGPGIRDLVRAASESDPGSRWKRLGETLDLERFITYMAIEVMVWDWDGYVLKPNNYRLYHDPTSGRLTFLPHGMDQMFQRSDGPIVGGTAGMVAQAVMDSPDGKERYLERMLEIFPRVFALADISRRIDDLVARAVDALADLPHAAARLRSGGESLRRQIEARARSVEEQLRQRPRPLAFDAAGAAKLGSAAWTTRLDSGSPAVEDSRGADGRGELRIAVRGRGGQAATTVGSWRLAVTLPRGRYRLEGRARASGVEALADKKGEGAGIRTAGSKTPRTNSVVGDSDWTDLAYEFEVTAARADVTLVAELRARAGMVAFDRESLRVVRLR